MDVRDWLGDDTSERSNSVECQLFNSEVNKTLVITEEVVESEVNGLCSIPN